ncbi:J domain-containing protein [Luteimonas sp. MC1895]|uniref:J domain-containing protein n=1 Tax=Luteimonas sp. MC1895 TaxID=2819513 RepID=UPI0018F10445|nr:J domain-containing protein [Luteimonas sp. MC1895]MBJ6978228.1 J domain-containing protein [Luteimonas sp. MC1895]
MNRTARATAGGIDFAKLYAELGVVPDCGLAAFKHAYRRRVAGLHPDRPPSVGRDPDALVALNLGYAAALEFHRGYGRLPGASAVPVTPAASPVGSASPGPAATPPARPAAGMARSVPSMRGLRVLTLPVLLLVVATWLWLPGTAPPPDRFDAPLDTPDRHAAPPQGLAQFGMDRATVATLIGEPVARSSDDSRWIYGPSWVRFECGRLADWYSSPLRPLRIAARTPVALADRPRHRRAAACPPAAVAGSDRVYREA